MSDLPEWVKPGASFRYFDRKFHVRAIVDGMVVLRAFWRSTQRWNYTVEHPVWFEIAEKDFTGISK